MSNDKNKKSKILTVITTILTISIALFLMFIGDIKVMLNQNDMSFSATLTGTQMIAYKDVTDIQYTEDFDIGKRVGGIGNLKIQAGNFKNDTFGKYKLYAFDKCNAYIIIKTDKKTIVTNKATIDETKSLYNHLKQKLNE